MGKHYYIYDKKDYLAYKSKCVHIDSLMAKLEKDLEKAEIDIEKSITSVFRQNLKSEVEPSENLLCVKCKNHVSWEIGEEMERIEQILDDESHIVVSEELEEFETWEQLQGELEK
jgi:hypothetical protein